VTAAAAAGLGLLLLVCVTAFAAHQVRLGRLDHIMRTGLVTNLVGTAVLWLRTDKPYEGRTLLLLGPGHGVTTADLLVVLPLAVATRVIVGETVRWRAVVPERSCRS